MFLFFMFFCPHVVSMNEFGPDGWKVLVYFLGFLLLNFFLSVVFGFLLNIIYVCRFQLSDCGIVCFQLFERAARLFFSKKL